MSGEGKLVLVTGATGYIGSHVVREFLDNGYRVRGTVRNLNKKTGLEHLKKWIENGDKLELVQANLVDPETMMKAAAGCDLVCHVASPFFVGCKDSEAEEKLFKPARQGTINVLNAAYEAKTVKKVVVTSSVAAILGGQPTVPLLEKPEEKWSDLDKTDNYSKSKTMAERAAWDFQKEKLENGGECFELATINPCLVVGPTLASSMATSHAAPKKFLNHEMPGVPDMTFGTVDVRDVALAHRLAMEKPEASGKRFVVQGQTTNMVHWAKVLAKEFKPLGYKVPTRKLPYFVLWLGSFFDGEIKGILPQIGKPPMDLETTQAETVLGMKFRSEQESLIDQAYSCIEMGVPGFKKTEKYIAAKN